MGERPKYKVSQIDYVEDRSSGQKRRADTRMYSTTHRLAAKHVAADAPIGLSTTNRKAPPALAGDLPSHLDFDRSSTNAYCSTRHVQNLLFLNCRKHRGVCARDVGPPSPALNPVSQSTYPCSFHLFHPNRCSISSEELYHNLWECASVQPRIWRRTNVLG